MILLCDVRSGFLRNCSNSLNSPQISLTSDRVHKYADLQVGSCASWFMSFFFKLHRRDNKERHVLDLVFQPSAEVCLLSGNE